MLEAQPFPSEGRSEPRSVCHAAATSNGGSGRRDEYVGQRHDMCVRSPIEGPQFDAIVVNLVNPSSSCVRRLEQFLALRLVVSRTQLSERPFRLR